MRLDSGGGNDRIKYRYNAIDGFQMLYGILDGYYDSITLCDYAGWYTSSIDRTYTQNPIISITGGNDSTNSTLINFFISNGTLQQEETSESESYIPQQTETIYLNGYDYRGWFGKCR